MPQRKQGWDMILMYLHVYCKILLVFVGSMLIQSLMSMKIALTALPSPLKLTAPSSPKGVAEVMACLPWSLVWVSGKMWSLYGKSWMKQGTLWQRFKLCCVKLKIQKKHQVQTLYDDILFFTLWIRLKSEHFVKSYCEFRPHQTPSRIVKLTRGSRYELPAIDTVEPLTLTTGKMALRGKVMVFQSLYIS